MKFFVIKKGHLYKGLSKESYNRSKLMVKKWDDNNLLDTKKTITISKMWSSKTLKFKVCTFEKLELQNFKNVLPHINGV